MRNFRHGFQKKPSQLGPVRPVIESVRPEINGGRYPIKRVQGDRLKVSATVILDGHDLACARILYRHESEKAWSSAPMKLMDKKSAWEGVFGVEKLGRYLYTVQAWADHFETWRHELQKKFEAGQDVTVELKMGLPMLKKAIKAARGPAKTRLERALKVIGDAKLPVDKRVAEALEPALGETYARYPDLSLATTYERELLVTVDRERAVFSSWYEFFPRSTSGDVALHGTFKTSEAMLPYIAEMGFDVIYLPPIHPIGSAFKKGKNNSLTPIEDDVGSPWGIGAKSGGHTSIHPELGTMADFKRFVAKAKKHGLEIALDIAFQCSPDHPWVKKFPEFFKKRPDGTIQYAENPPKKYQDIYPLYFESKEWESLWDELRKVVVFWIKNGIHIFRVDNPHTKPIRFWEWLIQSVKSEYPDVIFLSEAFTHPAMMYNLAKIGFTQSYTYFTWRNTPAEFKKYLEELTLSEPSEFYRPNFWPNTPDILPIHLQQGGRPAFLARVALAATLSSNYGLYGPAYELCVNAPFKEGGEEYLDSEKYEIKKWNLEDPVSIRGFIARLNAIRRENPALRRTSGVRFHEAGPSIVCFAKKAEDCAEMIWVAVSTDYRAPVSAEVVVPSGKAENLLDGTTGSWKGTWRVELTPENPVSIYRFTPQQ